MIWLLLHKLNYGLSLSVRETKTTRRSQFSNLRIRLTDWMICSRRVHSSSELQNISFLSFRCVFMAEERWSHLNLWSWVDCSEVWLTDWCPCSFLYRANSQYCRGFRICKFVNKLHFIPVSHANLSNVSLTLNVPEIQDELLSFSSSQTPLVFIIMEGLRCEVLATSCYSVLIPRSLLAARRRKIPTFVNRSKPGCMNWLSNCIVFVLQLLWAVNTGVEVHLYQFAVNNNQYSTGFYFLTSRSRAKYELTAFLSFYLFFLYWYKRLIWTWILLERLDFLGLKTEKILIVSYKKSFPRNRTWSEDL